MEEADGGTAIQQNWELILELIRRSHERRKQITSEEMGAVIQERDTARAQVRNTIVDIWSFYGGFVYLKIIYNTK